MPRPDLLFVLFNNTVASKSFSQILKRDLITQCRATSTLSIRNFDFPNPLPQLKSGRYHHRVFKILLHITCNSRCTHSHRTGQRRELNSCTNKTRIHRRCHTLLRVIVISINIALASAGKTEVVIEWMGYGGRVTSSRRRIGENESNAAQPVRSRGGHRAGLLRGRRTAPVRDEAVLSRSPILFVERARVTLRWGTAFVPLRPEGATGELLLSGQRLVGAGLV